jgi:DNA-binding NarL/FixJ family response regulator
VGEAVDGEDAIQQVQRLRPDVVIMDASMPKLSGIEATRQITRSTPDVRVIGLSMHDSDWMARTMIESGAVAFVEKSAPYEQLVEAIRATS